MITTIIAAAPRITIRCENICSVIIITRNDTLAPTTSLPRGSLPELLESPTRFLCFETLLVQRQQPLKALQLVVSHRAPNNAVGLTSGRGAIHVDLRIICRCDLVLAQGLERVEHSFGHKWLQLRLEAREKSQVAAL